MERIRQYLLVTVLLTFGCSEWIQFKETIYGECCGFGKQVELIGDDSGIMLSVESDTKFQLRSSLSDWRKEFEIPIDSISSDVKIAYGREFIIVSDPSYDNGKGKLDVYYYGNGDLIKTENTLYSHSNMDEAVSMFEFGKNIDMHGNMFLVSSRAEIDTTQYLISKYYMDTYGLRFGGFLNLETTQNITDLKISNYSGFVVGYDNKNWEYYYQSRKVDFKIYSEIHGEIRTYDILENADVVVDGNTNLVLAGFHADSVNVGDETVYNARIIRLFRYIDNVVPNRARFVQVGDEIVANECYYFDGDYLVMNSSNNYEGFDVSDTDYTKVGYCEYASYNFVVPSDTGWVNAGTMRVNESDRASLSDDGNMFVTADIENSRIIPNGGAVNIYDITLPDYVVHGANVTSVEESNEIPASLELSQNYPNPFNPSTNISFELPQSELVQLKVYNMLGQEVANLIDGRMNSGKHTVNFDASQLSSGVYIYRLVAGNQSITKKMMLIK